MNCKKCCGRRGLCPVSFGLALGITGGLVVFIWSVWAMYHGVSPMMAEHGIEAPTWASAGMHALWIVIKGFVFGFVFALIYDLFLCCSKRLRGNKCACTCSLPPEKQENILK